MKHITLAFGILGIAFLVQGAAHWQDQRTIAKLQASLQVATAALDDVHDVLADARASMVDSGGTLEQCMAALGVEGWSR